MPSIANSRQIKRRNITTLPSAGKDFINAPMRILILGMALILLNGLNTLKVLTALKFAP